MTKKNLKPQQAAPVQWEINTTSSEGYGGLNPQRKGIRGGADWAGFCGRRRRVIASILALTSNNIKSLFLLARAHDSLL